MTDPTDSEPPPVDLEAWAAEVEELYRDDEPADPEWRRAKREMAAGHTELIDDLRRHRAIREAMRAVEEGRGDPAEVMRLLAADQCVVWQRFVGATGPDESGVGLVLACRHPLPEPPPEPPPEPVTEVLCEVCATWVALEYLAPE